MAMTDILILIGLPLLVGMSIAIACMLVNLNDAIRNVSINVDNRYYDLCHEVEVDTEGVREDISKSLSDLNNLLNEYNKNLDKLANSVVGYSHDVEVLKETTLEFKMMVAKYAAAVYDNQHDLEKQLNSLGDSQMKILESMATVFHKIPPVTAKDIFKGGETHDDSEQGEDEGHTDETGGTSDHM